MDARNCSECGQEMPAGAAPGVCPRCLLALGLLVASGGDGLRIRCPHCQNPVEVLDEARVQDITCPSCHTHFSLVDDRALADEVLPDRQIAQFELLECVGRGAFGTVWKARDAELDRIVAVKVPRAGQLSPEDSEQFLREARAAAQLRHPNIVTVHEIGRAKGMLYIVSDFVKGITLADFLGLGVPDVRVAVTLCAEIADALQHAHDKGVYHRDLKPSNILLEQLDASPVTIRDLDSPPVSAVTCPGQAASQMRPHVTDFGLARRDSGEITMTIDGRIMGTPAYMSPEQARGDGHLADARSDVYSLGVVLFEMLTGERPFRGASRMLLHQVLHDEAPPARKLNNRVPRDLETICMKCLEKEPARRYASARQLADELRRFLMGVPIHARPVSRMQRFWRWGRRNPTVAVLTTAVAVALLLGLASTWWQWRQAVKQRHVAESHRRASVHALDQAQQRLARLYVERGLQSIDVAPHAGLPWFVAAMHLADDTPQQSVLHRLRLATTMSDLPQLVHFWPRATAVHFSPDGQHLAVVQADEVVLYETKSFRPTFRLAHTGHVLACYFAPQSDRLATLTRRDDGAVPCRLWNVTTGEPLTDPIVLDDPSFPVREAPKLRFSPDGKRLLHIKSAMHNRWYVKLAIRVFDSHTLESLAPTFKHHNQVDYTHYCLLSPDCTRVFAPHGQVYTGENDSTEVQWPDETPLPQQYDLSTGQPLHEPLDHRLDFYAAGSFGYSPDGEHLVTAHDGVVKFWNARNGQLERDWSYPADERIRSVAFARHKQRLSVITDRRIENYDWSTGQRLSGWTHDNRLLLSPSGRYVLWHRNRSEQGYLEDLDSETAERVPIPVPQTCVFSPDESRFSLRPEGRYVAGEYQGRLPSVVRRADNGQPLTPPWRFGINGHDDGFSPQGRYLLSKQAEGFWLWDLEHAHSLGAPFPKQDQDIRFVAFSHARDFLATLNGDHTVSVWNANDSNAPPRTLRLPSENWQRIAVANDGQTVVAIGERKIDTPDGSSSTDAVHCLQIWNVDQARAVTDVIEMQRAPRGWLHETLFAHDGKSVYVTEGIYVRNPKTGQGGTASTRIHAWDLIHGEKLAEQEVQFNLELRELLPGGRRCLVYRSDNTWPAEYRQPPYQRGALQLFDTATWTPASPEMHPESGHLVCSTLSPDGNLCLLATRDGTIETWDLTASQNGTHLANHDTATRLMRKRVFTDAIPRQLLVLPDSAICIALGDKPPGSTTGRCEIRMFSTHDGQPTASPVNVSHHVLGQCSLHCQLPVLAIADAQGVYLWDVQSGLRISPRLPLARPASTGSLPVNCRDALFSGDGRTLYVRAARGLFQFDVDRLHVQSTAERTPHRDIHENFAESFARSAALLSGHHIDAAGGYVPLNVEQFEPFAR